MSRDDLGTARGPTMIVPGQGIVGVFANSIALAVRNPTAAESDHGSFDEGPAAIVAAARHAAMSDDPEATRELFRRAATWCEAADTEPDLVIVAPVGVDWVMLAAGSGEAEWTGGPDGRTRSDGTRRWVDARVAKTVARIALRLDRAAQPVSGTDLRDGLALGSGLVLTLTAGDATGELVLPPPQQPATTTPADKTPGDDFVVFDLDDTPAENPPLPLADESSTPATFGVLIRSDGTTFALEREVVLGRDPAAAKDVLAGTAFGVRLEDPERIVGRMHARIVPTPNGVAVIDTGSPNGTAIARPGQPDWERIPVRQPVELPAGTRILIGRHMLTYDRRTG